MDAVFGGREEGALDVSAERLGAVGRVARTA